MKTRTTSLVSSLQVPQPNRNLHVGVSCLLAILFCAAASAQTTRTWDGGGSDILWTNATNWSGDTVPLSNSNGIVVFDSSSPLAAPTVDFGSNRTTGTLVISNVTNGVIFTAGTSGSLLTLAGGGIDMSSATGDLTFTNSTGWALSGNGSINVTNGRTLTWTTGSRLNGASNTLTGAGTKTGNYLMLATATNSTNSSTMNAGTLNITASGMAVGFATNSTASFFQTGGTVNIAGGGLNIAQQVGSSGTYELSSGTLNITGGNLSVGQNSNAASATFRQTGGTVNLGTGNNVLVGTGAGSSNNLLEITGGTFTQTNTGGALFSVGRNSDATATISGTAAVSANTLHLVDTSAASGTDAVLNINGGTFSAAAITSIANNTNGNSTATINLNGGVAELPALPSTRSAGSTAIINFNGGTLRPLTNSSAYLSGFTQANLTTNGAVFEVLSGRDITVAQVLQNAGSDAGTLRLNGPGVLTLTASNSYTGGTTVSSNGVLRVGHDAALGSGKINLGNGATLASDSATARTLTNNFAATGSSINLGQASGGTGLLTLGAPGQFFDIGTSNLTLNTIASVTMNAALTNSGSITKTGSGILQLNASNSFNGLTISSGVVALAANAGVGGTLGSGNVTNNATLRFARNSANTTNTFANNISGSGSLEKTNASTVIITGSNSYSGTTTVGGGALIINGNQSAANGAVTVNSGATLGGSGTIGGATTVSGTLSPGNSPGVLTFGSSLTLQGSTFMELNGLTRGAQYDGVNVGGLLTYGGSLTLNFGATFAAGNSFNLFDFDTYGGTFDSITFEGNYTGSLTRVGSTWTGTISGQDFAFSDATGNLDVVPEPSTASLLLIAGLGLASHVLRRRSR